jgi:hypothetical protein
MADGAWEEAAQGLVAGVDTREVTRPRLARARERSRRHSVGLALLLCVVAGLSGCAQHSSQRGTRVVVVERDFRLTASVTSVPAGLVTFHVVNHGPSTHEFVVDETFYSAESLPLQKNGLQVNEKSATLRTADSMSVIRVGTERDLTMQLHPGQYVIFCNLEGHYQGGMRLGFDVT